MNELLSHRLAFLSNWNYHFCLHDLQIPKNLIRCMNENPVGSLSARPIILTQFTVVSDMIAWFNFVEGICNFFLGFILVKLMGRVSAIGRSGYSYIHACAFVITLLQRTQYNLRITYVQALCNNMLPAGNINLI